jgi:hypothetical protein
MPSTGRPIADPAQELGTPRLGSTPRRGKKAGRKTPGQRRRPWKKKKKSARERKNRGEGEIGLPKDLCANLENCRDLLVK